MHLQSRLKWGFWAPFPSRGAHGGVRPKLTFCSFCNLLSRSLHANKGLEARLKLGRLSRFVTFHLPARHRADRIHSAKRLAEAELATLGLTAEECKNLNALFGVAYRDRLRFFSPSVGLLGLPAPLSTGTSRRWSAKPVLAGSSPTAASILFLQGVDFSSTRRSFLPAKDFLLFFHPRGNSVERYSFGTVLCPVHFLASLIVDSPFSTPLSFS